VNVWVDWRRSHLTHRIKLKAPTTAERPSGDDHGEPAAFPCGPTPRPPDRL